MKRILPVAALSAGLALLPAQACGPATAVPPPAEAPPPAAAVGMLPQAPESYLDLTRLWKRRPIPVCWEQSARSLAVEIRWVESAVREQIEKVSTVRFAGSPSAEQRWPTCSETSLGIRIEFVTGRPRSLVGQQWEPAAAGPRERPTQMWLNAGQGPYESVCEQRRRQCTDYLALHEFAHALGFLHEHLRSDAPTACREQFAHDPDDSGYRPAKISPDFDPQSITNYCANIFGDPMPISRLSKLDILALNTYYPPP